MLELLVYTGKVLLFGLVILAGLVNIGGRS
jgi:hypothetical protein